MPVYSIVLSLPDHLQGKKYPSKVKRWRQNANNTGEMSFVLQEVKVL
jgi:hypothetical protein